jgi:6-phosphogluconolactonase (cycloisomerase 2 family)
LFGEIQKFTDSDHLLDAGGIQKQTHLTFPDGDSMSLLNQRAAFRNVAPLLIALTLASLTAFAQTPPSAATTTPVTAEYLYVATSFSNANGGSLVGFRINSSGTLTRFAPLAPADTVLFVALAADPGGHFLFADEGTHLDSFQVNRTSGKLTRESRVGLPSGAFAKSIVVSPNREFLFASSSFISAGKIIAQVSTFHIDSAGHLALIHNKVLPTAGLTNGIAIHPTGGILYVNTMSTTQFLVSTLDVSTTGLLTFISSNAGADTSNTTALAVYPAGKFVYQALGSSPSVVSYSITSSKGALTKTAVVSCGCDLGPDFGGEAFMDPLGRYLVAATSQDGGASFYSISRTTGLLTPLPKSFVDVSIGPDTLAVNHTGQFVFLSNFLKVGIMSIRVNADLSTTVVSGSPFALPAGQNPGEMATVAVH